MLNTKRGLFTDARLRRAASLVIDRTALARVGNPFATVTDVPTSSYLPPGIPGHTEQAEIVLHPQIQAARRLTGHEPRTAVEYTCNVPRCALQAQIVKTDLARIGITVTVRAFPLGELFALLDRPGEPYDIGFGSWQADYLDPTDFLTYALETPGIAGSGFSDPVFTPRLAEAARLAGPRRYLTFARLAQVLARRAAPWLAYGNFTFDSFFSKRIGCQITQPLTGVDLAALCVRR